MFWRRKAFVVIRPLLADQADDCARLHADAFAHAWSADEIANLLALETIGVAALDTLSGALHGFALSRISADEAELLTITVALNARRRGVGRAILNEILLRAATG